MSVSIRGMNHGVFCEIASNRLRKCNHAYSYIQSFLSYMCMRTCVSNGRNIYSYSYNITQAQQQWFPEETINSIAMHAKLLNYILQLIWYTNTIVCPVYAPSDWSVAIYDFSVSASRTYITVAKMYSIPLLAATAAAARLIIKGNMITA